MASLTKMRILAVEPNPVFRAMLKTMFTKWGYEPVEARSGIEAWDILEREDVPKLLILEWMLPGTDGLEICRRLRKDRPSSYTYVLMLTARTSSQELLEAMEAGCDDYLTKPFNAHELRVRVGGARRRDRAFPSRVPPCRRRKWRIACPAGC